MTEIEKINKITEAINDFCENETSRQREDLYNYLNEKLELSEELTVYNYQGTNDHARFACEDESEFNYVVNKVTLLME